MAEEEAASAGGGGGGVNVLAGIALREVLLPILSWLLRSGTRQGQEPVPAELARITPRLGRIDSGARNRALFVTALLVSIVVVAYIQQDRPSFYRRLSVPWYASPRDVKRAWREYSKIVHPDKATAPDLANSAVFLEHARIGEILADKDRRWIYDRFGEDVVNDPRSEEMLNNYVHVVFVIVPYYISTAIFIFVLAWGKARSGARPGCFIALAVAFYLELLLRFDRVTTLDNWFPYITPYQQICCVHYALPIIFTYLVALAQVSYVDLDLVRHEELISMLAASLNRQDALLKAAMPADKPANEGEPASAEVAQQLRPWKIEVIQRHRKNLLQAAEEEKKKQGLSLMQILFLLSIGQSILKAVGIL